MNDPILTIGISFYNTANTLIDLCKCIFAQTFTDWELILIDDGSTDGGAENVSKITDPRVRVISDGVNQGRSARYNQITQLARGEYIARLDADDMSHPERFAKQIDFLRENPDVDVVSCDFLALTDQDELVSRSHGPTQHEEICANAWKSIYLQHGGIMGKTDWFRRFAYPEEYKIAIDQALLMSSYRESHFANLPEPLYFYRVCDTYDLKKHYKGELTVARLIWNLSRQHYPLALVIRSALGRYVRLGVYVAAELVGQRKRLINKRFGKVDEKERQMFAEALETIRLTPVPGLIEPFRRK